MLRQLNRSSAGSDSGTITAELAMALPSVALVIAVTVAGFGLQIERMKFVSVAATAARALGRGEQQVDVEALVNDVAPAASLKVEFLENQICANISQKFMVAGLQSFEVAERQCSRKMGL
jgi:Flp pilus assembly protein TadG